jgi:RNA polymerase sigma factor (sigma-70 family)
MLPPFQRLLDDHGVAVYRFLLASVGPHDAADCYQETIVAALKAYPTLAHADNLKAWLFTIAQRKMIDNRRAEARRPTPTADPPAVAVSDPEAAEPEIWATVRTLPPKQRAAVLHRFVGDLDYTDIALALDCSPDAARRSVHEAIKKLREVWHDR